MKSYNCVNAIIFRTQSRKISQPGLGSELATTFDEGTGNRLVICIRTKGSHYL